MVFPVSRPGTDESAAEPLSRPRRDPQALHESEPIGAMPRWPSTPQRLARQKMDFLGYLLFGVVFAALLSPKWVGEWLAKARNAYDENRDAAP
jgi:hypothetical protein